MTKIQVPFGTRDVRAGPDNLARATDAEAKAATSALRLLTADNLMQGAPAVAAAIGTLEAAFVAHYQFAPDASSATFVHAAVTLANGATTTVTTAITNPDVPRTVTVKGNQATIASNVVITGTNFADEVITDTITLNDASEVEGTKAFKTVTSILLPARTNSGDTVSIGVAKKFGIPHIAYNALSLLVKLFDGSTDSGTLAVDDDELEKNLFSLNGTPNGTRVVDLFYLI